MVQLVWSYFFTFLPFIFPPAPFSSSFSTNLNQFLLSYWLLHEHSQILRPPQGDFLKSQHYSDKVYLNS